MKAIRVFMEFLNMSIDSGKKVGSLEKLTPLMTNLVSVLINLAREIY